MPILWLSWKYDSKSKITCEMESDRSFRSINNAHIWLFFRFLKILPGAASHGVAPFLSMIFSEEGLYGFPLFLLCFLNFGEYDVELLFTFFVNSNSFCNFAMKIGHYGG